MYVFAQWFLFWTQDHERREHQMLSHNFYIAYPFVHKSCSGLFQSVFMSLLDLMWIICYFSQLCPRLIGLFAAQYHWCDRVQCQCHESISLVAVWLLILSTSRYMRNSSVHLPNFKRNIILWFHFSCIASGCNKKHGISLRYLLLFQTI